MTILLHKPYLVKVTTKGGGGSKIPKNVTTWFLDGTTIIDVSLVQKLDYQSGIIFIRTLLLT